MVVGVVVMVGVEVVVLVGLAVVVAMAWFLFFSKDIFFFSLKIGGKKKWFHPPKMLLETLILRSMQGKLHLQQTCGILSIIVLGIDKLTKD